MKKILTFFLTIALLLILTVGMTATSPPEYTDYSGNYLGEFCVDPPIDSIAYFNGEGEIVNSMTAHFIDFDVSENGQYLSFTTSNLLVTSIYIKGGNGYRIYEWPEGVSSAENLVSPLNGGGQVPKISHYGLGFIIIVKPTPTIGPTPKTTPTSSISPTPIPTPTLTISPTPTPTIMPTTTLSPTPTSYNPETGDGPDSNVYLYIVSILFGVGIGFLLIKKR